MGTEQGDRAIRVRAAGLPLRAYRRAGPAFVDDGGADRRVEPRHAQCEVAAEVYFYGRGVMRIYRCDKCGNEETFQQIVGHEYDYRGFQTLAPAYQFGSVID